MDDRYQADKDKYQVTMESRQNSTSTITTDRAGKPQRLSVFKCILESFTHYESK